MAVRVVHCGTGNMGRVALRSILRHPDLELVGHYVWTPGKLGVDSGTLPVVNAIPVICDAPSGQLGPLDLPRYWSRDVRPIA